MPQQPDNLEPPPDLISKPAIEQFKQDRRTRVWLAEGAGRRWVIKKYTDARLRQLFAWGLHIHPAQREWRRALQLEQDDLRVVLPVKMMWAGGWVYSIAPHGGESYQRLILKGLLRDPAWRAKLTEELAICAADVIERGWFLRDLQPSNMVRGADGAAWLIDVGSARRSPSPQHVLRMLGLMVYVMRYGGATVADAARVLSSVRERRPWQTWPTAAQLDNPRHLTRGVIEVAQRLALQHPDFWRARLLPLEEKISVYPGAPGPGGG